MKEFSKWTIEEVEEYFHITPLQSSLELTAWQTAEVVRAPQEEAQLLKLCHSLQQHVNDWNEEELKLHFISLLLHMVNYTHDQYHVFFERTLSVKIDGERLRGVVDCIIAQGRRSPKRPYFCLHEYKQERHSSNDPLGQVTIAMVAAQRLNNDGKPVHGAYVVGRQWFFLVLQETSYALSLAYDATKEEDLYKIFSMLRYIKQRIQQELNLINTTG
ncbi:conserved hypothetical protein [Gammaproteobacteria bacterium]